MVKFGVCMCLEVRFCGIKLVFCVMDIKDRGIFIMFDDVLFDFGYGVIDCRVVV